MRTLEERETLIYNNIRIHVTLSKEVLSDSSEVFYVEVLFQNLNKEETGVSKYFNIEDTSVEDETDAYRVYEKTIKGLEVFKNMEMG